jgi:hypothetical protein
VPAVLLTLALGLLAIAPVASAAPAICATNGLSPITGEEGGLGQEFTVGPDGGDLHAFSIAAFGPDGLSQLSILPIRPLDGKDTPDETAPLQSATIDLPPDATVTATALAHPLRLQAGRYVVFLAPQTAASWLLCVPPTAGGAWLHSGQNWFPSASEAFALGLDLQPQDLTAPVVSVTPPVSPTRTPEVAFGSDDPTATYTCSVDGGAAEPCTSPFAPAGLADGQHSVAIVARDVMENVSAPATATFTVDTAAPTAAITIVPGNGADHTTAITVVLSEAGTFTCQLDGAPVACAASFTVDPASEGNHTLTVTATDVAGNSGDTPATFLADWTAPVVAPLDDLEVTADAGADDPSDRHRAGAIVEFAPVATDNFDLAPTVSCTPPSGSFFPLGSTGVSCAASDASGNTSAPVTFRVNVVQPPPSTADVDLAYDPADDRVEVTESHGGTIVWAGRRTITAAVGDHETRVNLRRTDEVADLDLDDGLRVQYLRYDGGRRVRPTSNGYAFRSSERRDGSLKRLVIAVRAGRNAVIVKYSAGSDQSVVRYLDLSSDRTLRVVHVDGLVVPHLRSDAGRMLIDVGGGG